MRHHGTLTRWNEDRGFGFIAPAGGGAALFVHVSAFPRDGQRPTQGEVLTYLTETAPDGKLRAVSVLRPGAAKAATRASRPPRVAAPPLTLGKLAGRLLGLVAMLAIGYALYAKHVSKPGAGLVAEVATRPALSATQAPRFSCDGRQHCSQMSSCEEATYFIRHCPGTQMDGDGDGVPCERQLCP